MPLTVIAAPDPLDGSRVRTRRVTWSEYHSQELAKKARASGGWHFHVEHGGAVANAYKYPATTSTLLAVASPEGMVVVWYGTLINANKASLCGAANACVAGAGDLFDGRTGKARKERARELLRTAHREVFTRDQILSIAHDAALEGRDDRACEIASQAEEI